MERAAIYNTKQREAVLKYIISLKDTHVTAAQIVEHFENEKSAIGRTTVYRHLDKMMEKGIIRKYTTDGVSGACYQYVGNSSDCHAHVHLKCEQCGVLQHLDCSALDEMQNHFSKRHNFEVDALKTVLYGRCGDCLNHAPKRRS